MSDLDNLLQELDGIADSRQAGAPAASSTSSSSASSSAASAPRESTTWGDLDAELASFDSSAKAGPPADGPKPNPKAAAVKDLGDDLDQLMQSLGPAKGGPAPTPAPAPAPAAAPASEPPAPAPAPAPVRDDSRKTVVVTTPTSKPCANCGSAISGAHLEAQGQVWHMNCFNCESCKGPISPAAGESSTNYFQSGEGKNLCQSCHDRDFRCTKCGEPLHGEYLVGDGVKLHTQCVDKKSCAKCAGAITTHNISALGQNWHPDCFTCTGCSTKLGTSFFSKEEKPYCEACIQKAGVKTNVTCSGCGRDVTGQYLTFGSQNFHTECLKCFKCKNVLPSDGFYNVNDQPSCLECAQQSS